MALQEAPDIGHCGRRTLDRRSFLAGGPWMSFQEAPTGRSASAATHCRTRARGTTAGHSLQRIRGQLRVGKGERGSYDRPRSDGSEEASPISRWGTTARMTVPCSPRASARRLACSESIGDDRTSQIHPVSPSSRGLTLEFRRDSVGVGKGVLTHRSGQCGRKRETRSVTRAPHFSDIQDSLQISVRF